MASSIPILWPDDISVDVVSPIAILRAQVEPLQKKTRGLVRVEISTLTSEESTEIVHTMDLVAPSLNNYRYQILSVSHSKDQVYPSLFEAKCFEIEPFARTVATLSKRDWRTVADSEPAFIEHLGTVLKSQEVRSVIDSLLARINELTTTHTSPSPPETSQ